MDYEEEKDSDDDQEKFIAEAREKFLLAVEKEKDNRELALEDIKFGLLGEQWSAEDIEARRSEGKPTLTINKFPAHIRQVVNDARQNKPTIRARPVDDYSDTETAEILNGLIRNIEVSSNADVAYDTALTHAVAGGYPGYIRINTQYADDESFDQDIVIERVNNQFSIYGDPYATSADGSDWNCCFVVDRITLDEYKERFPKAEENDWIADDKSEYEWINDDGVWIAEYWKREDIDKTVCLLSDGDVVDEEVYNDNLEMFEALGITKTDSRVVKSKKVTQYIINSKEILEENDWIADDKSEYEWINDDGVWIAEYWKREDVDKTVCLLSDGDVVDEEVYKDNLEMFEALGITKTDSRVVKSKKVTQYIINSKEILEENEWSGRYIPIVPCYGEEVNIENKRIFKSLIRDSKDSARMLNFWRSTATELVSSQAKAPFIAEEDSLVDLQKWATANTKNYAYLEYKKGRVAPQRQPFAGVPAGVLQEAINSSDDIRATMGMFGASIGEQDNAVSGRAILARQRESDTGTFHFIDNQARALRQVGQIIVDLIPHVYTKGRVIRILGEDKKESENIKLGQPKSEDDISNIYDFSVGKYDVVVEVGPGYTTKRQEAAQQMIEFSRVNPAASSLISDLIAKNLDWPGADEIAERFKAMLPPQVTGEDPQVQALQQQLQQVQQQAQQAMQQLQQQLEQVNQDKQIDVEKVKIDAYNAETNRLKTVSTSMTPEQIQMMVIQTIQNLMQTPDITPGQDQQIQPEMAQQEVLQQ